MWGKQVKYFYSASITFGPITDVLRELICNSGKQYSKISRAGKGLDVPCLVVEGIESSKTVPLNVRSQKQKCKYHKTENLWQTLITNLLWQIITVFLRRTSLTNAGSNHQVKQVVSIPFQYILLNHPEQLTVYHDSSTRISYYKEFIVIKSLKNLS